MIEFEKIGKFINYIMRDWDIPGLSLGIIHEKNIVFSKGFGVTQVNKKTTVNEHTLFRIGSATKAFTATAIGILVDKKMLDWNDPIKKYLPEFQLSNTYASTHVTINDLLSHQSGIANYDNLLITSVINNRKQIFDIIKYFKIKYENGTKFTYNNFMYAIIGLLVEKLTKLTWEEFVRENIFNPLGMLSTYASMDEISNLHKLAKPHYKNIKDETIHISKYFNGNYSFLNPAGGIISNTEDMEKWLLLNLNTDIHNERIISKSSITNIHSPKILVSQMQPPNEFMYNLYGLGWHIRSYKGNILISHGGNVGNHSSEISFMPENDIGIIVLCNRGNVPITKIISMYVYDILLNKEITDWNSRFIKMYKYNEEKEKKQLEERRKQKIANTKPTNELHDYVGMFSNKCYGDIKIKKKKSEIMIWIKNVNYPLYHFHYNVFEFYDNSNRRIEVNFNLDFNGKISTLSIKFNEKEDIVIFNR